MRKKSVEWIARALVRSLLRRALRRMLVSRRERVEACLAEAEAIDGMALYWQWILEGRGFVFKMLSPAFFRAGLLTLLAAVLGLGIAYVDTRPTWDDTGISAVALLAVCAALGAANPRRPWL